MTNPKRHPHADVIHAYAEGAKVQYLSPRDEWMDVETPNFNPYGTYRIKPETIKVKRKLVGTPTIDENKIGDVWHYGTNQNTKLPILGWVEYTLEEGKITNVEYEFY